MTNDLQDMLNKISRPFRVLAGFYILAVAFSGFSLILCVGCLFWPTSGISRVTAIVAWSATFVLFISNIIVVVSVKAADKINVLGQHVGLSVSTGRKFAALTWTAFALALVMAVYWAYETRQDRKTQKNPKG